MEKVPSWMEKGKRKILELTGGGRGSRRTAESGGYGSSGGRRG
jgi:hypothetical protein